MKTLTLPLTKEAIKTLEIGEIVTLSGTVFTARDQAHKRITSLLASGGALPFPLTNSAIYYCGPTPARKNEIIGSCGPTTSARMDAYTPAILDGGASVLIGKGERSEAVKAAVKSHGAVYLTAVGGAAALIKNSVISCELVAFPDLGCEAVYRLEVKDFEVVVNCK